MLVTKLQDSVSARTGMEDISVIFVLRDKWSKGGSVLRVRKGTIVISLIHVPYPHFLGHMMAPSPATAFRGEQESVVRML